MALLDYQTAPLRSLAIFFTSWKVFLLAIALGASIGPDYDTSTSLFFERVYGQQATIPVLAQKLTRWDALYFMHAARVGKIYEQEWAFGIGLSDLVSGLLRLSPVRGDETALEPLLAVVIAHASHLLSVIALYKLTNLVSSNRRLAFVASVLHIISPAGLFLSAPYAESPFSCLTFVGNWIFALSYTKGVDSLQRGLYLFIAGIIFGISALFRSNGLASGVLFAVEAIRCLLAFFEKPNFKAIVSLIPPVIGGICIAVGFVTPQVIAWSKYCGSGTAGSLRPWCEKTIPSIYGFVQEHYW